MPTNRYSCQLFLLSNRDKEVNKFCTLPKGVSGYKWHVKKSCKMVLKLLFEKYFAKYLCLFFIFKNDLLKSFKKY